MLGKLSTPLATRIAETINQVKPYPNTEVTLEQIKALRPIPRTSKFGFTVYALQYYNFTILIKVSIKEHYQVEFHDWID